MKDRNRVYVSGHLGRDPIRIDRNKPRVEFPLAINEDYFLPSGDKKEKTTWITIVAYDATADFCYDLGKGSWVDIEAKLEINKFERDGQEHQSTKLIAREVISPPECRRKRDVAIAKPTGAGYGISEDDIPS